MQCDSQNQAECGHLLLIVLPLQERTHSFDYFGTNIMKICLILPVTAE